MGSNGTLDGDDWAPPAVKAPLNSSSVLVSARFHPHEDVVTRQVNGYFLEHWPFPTKEARHKFVKAGFPRVTCAYFPISLDERIPFACCLLTLLFLVDGEISFTRKTPSFIPILSPHV